MSDRPKLSDFPKVVGLLLDGPPMPESVGPGDQIGLALPAEVAAVLHVEEGYSLVCVERVNEGIYELRALPPEQGERLWEYLRQHAEKMGKPS